jgi:HAD superfamily hydrolase (TIGR01509 family)
VLVIFDCDGVLVDSETLSAQVFSKQLQAEGIVKSPAECMSTFKGHTLSSCVDLLVLEFGRTLSHSFIDDLKCATQEAFIGRLKAVDGVELVLKNLKQRSIPFCVASNGELKKIQHSLKITQLWPYFEGVCFSAEFVVKGKPAPDLFLWAADAMGHAVSEVVIVEDSETGVQAGLAAGMKVLYFKSEINAPSDLLGVEHGSHVKKFTHMAQLMSLLRSL